MKIASAAVIWLLCAAGLATGLADPKIEARLANLGGDVLALSPADFSKLIADETEKWGKLIRTLNIKAE